VEMTVVNLGEDLIKVGLVGRLDSPGVGKVEAQLLSQLVPAAGNAIIDLSSVDFVSSMGIRMLVSAAKGLRARQAKLALFGAQPRVLRVLEAVALQQIVPICPTEAEALAAVTPA